jgi:two-component system, cell cycle response regulator DivK
MGSVVLIVEDDPETRELYHTVFAAAGFGIEEAHNGFQALEKTVTASPDLVLTDISIPGVDGIDLCRRLRADPRTREIPLLAVTGYSNRQYQDRAMKAGADSVLFKPLDPGVLVAEARWLIARRADYEKASQP